MIIQMLLEVTSIMSAQQWVSPPIIVTATYTVNVSAAGPHVWQLYKRTI